MNNSPEDPGGYSSAAFGSLCTAISPRRAARFDRQFVLSCGRNRKFKLSRIHIIAEINRFIVLRSDDNIDLSLFSFKLNRNHIACFGFVNLYPQSSEIGLHIVRVSRFCEYIGDVMFAVYGSAVKTEEAFRFTFKSSPLQRWSAHLRQNGMTTTCK
ncbi:MAG: hypothetical protein ACLS44_09000 [Christensenellales bacterium]